MSSEGNIYEGMEVYGNNDRFIGTVDAMHGDGFHVNGEHIPTSAIARVTENRVYLSDTGARFGRHHSTRAAAAASG